MFISEIHYENEGADSGEFIEITGLAGTDLTGWRLVFYNGRNQEIYTTQALLGIIPLQSNGLGTQVIDAPLNGIQNGIPNGDGVALISPAGKVCDFLSYEGTIQAGDGPALGLTSFDIGVAESDETPASYSLQRINDKWVGPRLNTRGQVNGGNTLTDHSCEAMQQNSTTAFNRTTKFTIQGTTVHTQPLRPQIQNHNWQLQASGQFVGGNAPDLIWQNIKTGQLLLWEDEGIRAHPLPKVNASEWAIVGTGFFNTDTHEDLLWYDAATQQVAVWYMNGQGGISDRISLSMSDEVAAELQGYELQASGDFDGGGFIDLLWVKGYGVVDVLPDLPPPRTKITRMINREVTNAADFDAPQALGTRLESQEWQAYLSKKGNQPVISGSPFPFARGIGDYNGDGQDDLAIGGTSNISQIWLMNGLSNPEILSLTG